MSSEQVQSRLSVLKGDAMLVLRNTFMKKVQLEDEMESNTINLHFHRGFLEGLQMANTAIEEINRGDQVEAKIEEMKGIKFNKTQEAQENSDNHDDKKEAEAVIGDKSA